ncbi:MAG: TatD family hydrolase [Desulfobacterium sp.]
MKLCDVHTHLQDLRLSSTIHQVIHKSMAAGVTHMVCCGVQESDWHGVVTLAAQYPGVFPAFGLHPWFISSRSPDWLDRLEQLLQTTGAAVGEIGLDRSVSPRNDAEQISVFTSQLKLAKEYKRPVNIHCRKAFGLLADLLKENGGLPHGGVIHSYSGSADMVKVFEKSGAYISFSGSLTRPHNKKVRQAARAVSLERLLIETDTPDILPTGAPDGLNEPAHVHLVLKTLAQLREESIEVLANATFANAIRLFKIQIPDQNPDSNIQDGCVT